MKFRLLFLLIILFSSCAEEPESETSLTNYLPENSAFVIQSDSLAKFLSRADSTNLLTNNSGILKEAAWDHLKNLTTLTSPQKALVAFVSKKNGGTEYLVISDSIPELKIDSLKNRSIETLKFDSFEIKKIGTEEFTTYTASTGNAYFASSSLQLLEKTLQQDEKSLLEDQGFRMVLAAADPGKTTLFINNTSLDQLLAGIFSEINIPISGLAAWTVVDLEISGGNLLLNGVASSPGNSATLLDIFEGTASQPNEISKITPTSASGFYSFTYSDFSRLYSQLANFRKDSVEINKNHLLNFSKEAGVIFLKNNNVFVINTTDPELAAGSFPATEQVSEFREIPVYENSDPDEFSEKLKPLINESNLKYYAFLDNFMLFSETVAGIEAVISGYQNNASFEKQANYSEAVENLASSSSLLFVFIPKKINENLENAASKEGLEDVKNLDLKQYSLAALQFVQEENFAHVHGFLFSEGKTPSAETVNEISSIKLPSPLGTKPFVVNLERQSEVLVQDENNILYLYSLDGKLQWKKQLKGRIMGEVQEVDIYKNGNVQIAFATPGEVQVLDRNGNTVKPFPLEFNDPVTQPLSVFDYDTKRDYRLVVTQTNNLLMYDGRGKAIKGFNFGKTGSEIARSPKHIRIGNKDYIVVSEADGTINILSRQGKSRISVNEKVQTENDWFENERKFVSATEDGNVIFINESGKIEKRSPTANGKVEVVARENLLVSLSENILSINGKEINLDFGLYSAPQIFGSGQNLYIAVTDTQAKKVYIFDQNGNLLPGLPVYGNSIIDLSTGNNPVFVVQGEENSVLVYRL